VYLLDTDIISNLRKSKPNSNLVAWLGDVDPDTVGVSAITVFDIQAGAILVRDRDVSKANDIEAWLDGFVLAGQFSIVPFGAEVARVYAGMFVSPSLKNFLLPNPTNKTPKSGADLIVAATAIVHGAVVVSGNKGDFHRIKPVSAARAL
jgi:predicted nucleic acid-binding protein